MQIVKIEGHEADDVVATLTGQVLQKGYRVVIASPDKDFKQLIAEDVQLVMPLEELNRWSFYTLKHYTAQYNCEPRCDLSFSKYEMQYSDTHVKIKISMIYLVTVLGIYCSVM